MGIDVVKVIVDCLGVCKINMVNVFVFLYCDIVFSLFGYYVGVISGGSFYCCFSFLLDSLGK